MKVTGVLVTVWKWARYFDAWLIDYEREGM